jgi:O-antigen/teichoic acid export membrane protein
MSDTLRTYESMYLCISSLLAVALWLLAPSIAEHWLRSETLAPNTITTAIRLMGISVALQLPSGLYFGGLLGLQKQVLSNSLQIAWGLLRGLGAVLVLWLGAPTIIAFAVWQLIANAAYCSAVRFFLWRSLPASPVRPEFTWRILKTTWRYAAGLTGMACFSTILMQTDKLVVSKMLSLETLGYYSLASTLASAPLILAGPIAMAVFPQFTGLVAQRHSDGLRDLYRRSCELVAVAIVPAGVTLALFSARFIFAWTGSPLTAQKAGSVAALLAAGQLVQALMIIPSNLALAHGYVRLNLYVGLVSVIIITPLLVVLIGALGILGAGVSWLALNVLTLPFYMHFLHRRFLPGELQRWAVRALGRPFLAACPFALAGFLLAPRTSSRLATLLAIGLIWALATAAATLASPDVRKEFRLQAARLGGESGILSGP